MDHVVVDVEIQKTIDETPGGRESTDKLGVGVACVWEYNTQRMRVYGPKEVEQLQERLLQADRITGFNIWNFDYPVIWGLSKKEWANALISKDSVKGQLLGKTNDILRNIWNALRLNPDQFIPKTHGGYKLDDVASMTISSSKIGNGADAPIWYQAGDIQKVANYCADDVAIERDLSDFIDKYGYVLTPKGRVAIPKNIRSAA